MKKWIILVLSCFFILNTFGFTIIFAEEEISDVKITVISEQKAYEKEFTAEVQVSFYNQDFYNDEIFLSYHILKKEKDGTEEILEFENPRVKVVLDESGTAVIKLQATLKELIDGAYMEFDLVDESNLFWFSYNQAICLSTDRIELLDRPIYRQIVHFKQAVKNETGIFIINFMIFIGGIGVYIYVRRKKIFEW
ncbi:MAG: hypothetical protein OSJ62_13120 [Lachnospiraceae bacterium]|nr:hypothetical protein [Lachnospiraceae bacterium]